MLPMIATDKDLKNFIWVWTNFIYLFGLVKIRLWETIMKRVVINLMYSD